MSAPSTDPPRTAYGSGLGLLAGLAFAVVYALSAELIGLTFGLPVVGLVGGWLIGNAVAYGAWREREHAPHATVRAAAIVIAVITWLAGLILAYVVSQALIPQAATGVLERLSVRGFSDYLFGSFDFVRLLHLVALAFSGVMAWRAAR